MKLLLDTHLLLWAAAHPDRLSAEARSLVDNAENELLFSAASLWEVAIKRGLGRDDFKVDVRVLRRGLLDNGYSELPIFSDHVVAIESLPTLHKDPFRSRVGGTGDRRGGRAVSWANTDSVSTPSLVSLGFEQVKKTKRTSSRRRLSAWDGLSHPKPSIA